MDEVIGRKKEIDILKSKYNYNKAELIVLFGKKGVGKTFLVRTIFPDMFFHATALYNGDAKNLVNFSKELNDGNIYTDWSSAFFCIKR
jgi:AAA+ ATPase superfamily predicted ATPase